MSLDLTHTARLNTEHSSTGDRPLAFLTRIGRCHKPHQPDPLMVQLTNLGELSLGRGAEDALEPNGSAAALRLADPSLSARHARIVRLLGPEGAQYMLEDLGSTNGCRVNGQRISELHPLQPGDVLETGQTFWSFWLGPLQELDPLLERCHAGGAPGYGSSVSLRMLQALVALDRIASSDLSVILHGESGTGKEGLAQELHMRSGRSGPLVALNCAAIPEGLIESELFGHRKGAFTGAVADKPGLIEAAEGGTLLLDEVGDMPLPAQAKLLRVLQERAYVRLGETRTHRVDVRFIASTHHDLRQMVKQQQFRGDLYARLNGLSITLPPLRRRKEDLGLLISTFLGRSSSDGAQLTLTHEAYRALVLHDWPFNIRELEKAISVAAAFAEGATELKRIHLPDPVRDVGDGEREHSSACEGGGGGEGEGEGEGEGTGAAYGADGAGERGPLDYTLQADLLAALRQHKGKVSAVAAQIETSRMQVYRWLKKLGLDAADFRK